MDLAGAEYFSSLDAAQAFHNIPVKKESQALTAFITAFGTFQFQRMPFGLKNAGAVYCRLVKRLLDHLKLIENMEEPKSGKEVQSMIGFIQFFSNFVPRFAQLTLAMNALRNKRHLAPGDWNEECK